MALTVTSAALASIEITPRSLDRQGGDAAVTATGVFTDHSTQDLTQQVVWASSNELVAQFAGDAGGAGRRPASTSGTRPSRHVFGVSGAADWRSRPRRSRSSRSRPGCAAPQGTTIH